MSFTVRLIENAPSFIISPFKINCFGNIVRFFLNKPCVDEAIILKFATQVPATLKFIYFTQLHLFVSITAVF